MGGEKAKKGHVDERAVTVGDRTHPPGGPPRDSRNTHVLLLLFSWNQSFITK